LSASGLREPLWECGISEERDKLEGVFVVVTDGEAT
jgi:hypothetical protein